MPVRGWYARYSEILSEFGYARSADTAATRILDGIIKKPAPEIRLKRLIRGRTVFVMGAGPSLKRALRAAARLRGTKIVADSAVKAVLEAGIVPDIVVTDLDGDEAALRKADRSGSLMLVHAHGDNAAVLPAAKKFANVIATTQGRPVGRARNYGGFTDGDRCVFLADSFGAEKIILLGMDFDGRIGGHSSTARRDRRTKAAKLHRAKALLQWLAKRSQSRLYTTSGRLEGFESVRYGDLRPLVRP